MADRVETTSFISGNIQRVYIDTLDHMPGIVKPVFSPYEIISERYQRYTINEDFPAYFAPNVKHFRLPTDLSCYREDATMENVITNGEVMLSGPTGAYGTVHLLAKDVGADVSTEIIGPQLPDTPSFFASLTHPDTPPNAQDIRNTRFTLSFGGVTPQARISWGGDSTKLFFRSGIGQYVEGMTTIPIIVDAHEIPMNDWARLMTDREQVWEIWSVGVDLVVVCTSLSEAWTIKNVGHLPAGKWRFTGTGAGWAVNIQPIRFQMLGVATSPIYQLQVDYGNIQPTLKHFPGKALQQPGTDIGLTAIYPGAGAGNFRDVKFSISLSTEDAYHTPILQAWQPQYDPVIRPAANTWQEVTHLRSASEKYNRAGGNSVDLTFMDHDRAFTSQLGETAKHGRIAVAYEAGYEETTRTTTFPEGGGTSSSVEITATHLYPRICGVALARNENEPWGTEADTYGLHVSGWDALFARMEMQHWPCLVGEQAGNAIAYYLRCAGVPADHIEGAADFPTVITDPLRNYDQPVMLPPNGGYFLDFLREKLLDRFGIRLEIEYRYEEDGETRGNYFKLRPSAPGAPAFTVTNHAAAGPEDPHLRSIRGKEDTSESYNVLIVQGKSRDGYPIVYAMQDDESLSVVGSRGYLGGIVSKTIVDDDLLIPLDCRKRAESEWAKRKPVERIIELTNGDMHLWERLPGEVFTVIDEETDLAGDYVINEIAVQANLTERSPTIIAEAI